MNHVKIQQNSIQLAAVFPKETASLLIFRAKQCEEQGSPLMFQASGQNFKFTEWLLESRRCSVDYTKITIIGKNIS